VLTPGFNNQLHCSLGLRRYSAGMNPHESAFAESFISKARRERALELPARQFQEPSQIHQQI
jgi:hypothetical protein